MVSFVGAGHRLPNRRLIHAPLDDGQFDGLVAFIFNLGAGALQCSTLRCKASRKEHAVVPAAFHRCWWVADLTIR